MGNYWYEPKNNNLKNEMNLNLLTSLDLKYTNNLTDIPWLINFQIIKLLYDGFHSKIFFVEKNGKFFVLKIIDIKKISNRLINTKNEEQNIIKIVNNSNNFVKIIKNYKNKNLIVYLMEYLDNGSLYDILMKKNLNLEYNQVIYILFKLFQSVFYLNKNKILYNNIKIENILFDKDFNIKLSDMILSLKLNTIDKDLNNEINYYSPEKVMDKKLTTKSDIWSIGVIGFILVFNQLPYTGSNRDEIIYKIISCNYEFPKKINFKFEKFFKDIFTYNPKNRLGNDFEEISNHILFHDFIDNESNFRKEFLYEGEDNWIMTKENSIKIWNNKYNSESINKKRIRDKNISK